MHSKRRPQVSSWFGYLAVTRIVLDATEMIGGREMTSFDPMALGLFMRMLPYVMGKQVVADNPVVLARYAGIHIATFRKWWPEMQRLFERVPDGWRLAPCDWYTVQTISAERQSLRHLLGRLVEHWGSACVYCGRDRCDLQIEHIVPRKRGGSDDLTNLTLSCAECNNKKRTQTAAEFGFPHVHDIAARIQ